MDARSAIVVRELGLCDYGESVARMRAFTDARGASTPDELWVLEHPPVFTQGQAGRPEHVLAPGSIPVVQADRGGQVTYHGPGQVVIYVLVDLRRLGIGIRTLVTCIEQSMIATCAAHGVAAFSRREAPGVYVERRFAGATRPLEVRKIGSLGLRVRHGCSYHGLAFNVAMDLEPFDRIDPCGYPGLHMTQLADLVAATALPPTFAATGRELARTLVQALLASSASRKPASLS
ncbi:MAG TPA: lipoyl(octanoyl) transferase LipB [Nevskiaceae bacterium]|nr:lipoyl(octanoyl) transferase LipB [Nevskiaceae bacterium]